MGGIDRMIATALSYEIKKELKLDILKKTERELFLEHGMSIKLSIEHFHKFSSSLRNNSNIDVKKFENKNRKARFGCGGYYDAFCDRT